MENKLIEAFDTFAKNILLIYTQKAFITKAFNKEYEEINDSTRAMKSHSLWFDNMLKYGSKEYLISNQLDKEEILSELYRTYNRQLQFILVSACEVFQKYLDEVYSILGFIDYTLWKAKHLGDITISKLSNKDKYDLDWYRKKVHNGSSRLMSNTDQLKQIRLYIPQFKNIESKHIVNSENIFKNLYFNFELVTQLRHRIVHNNGVVLNKEKFKKRILNSQNDYEKEKYRDYYIKSIDIFFRKEYNNTIMLINQKENNSHIEYDILEPIIDDLISYAKLISDIVILQLKSNIK